MKTETPERRIYRYLLGDLPEEEQFALEQESLADAELFEQVWAAENELIDRYVRGKLTVADKQLFETHYLASPVHRERLAFARSLIQAADSTTQIDFRTEPSANWWISPSAAWKSREFRWALATAVLLFAASSLWLFVENRRLREQVDQASHERVFDQRIQELEKELETQREQRDELAAELAALKEAESQTVEPRTQLNPAQQRSVVSFLLSPVLMRAGGKPQELKIPPEITVALLKMNVQEPGARTFQASLRTVEGREIWSRSALKSRQQEKDGVTISVSIPATKLPTNDYILTLSTINKANELEELNRYFFRVTKQ